MKIVTITVLFLLYLQCVYTQNRQYDSLKSLISSAKDDSTKYWRTADLIWGYLYSYPDSAVLYIQQNILLAQKMRSDDALFMGYSQYAILEQVNGNYPGALQYQLQSLRAAERTKNSLSISQAYLVLGDLYREAGDFEKSIYNLRKAKSFLESNLNTALDQKKSQEMVSTYTYNLILLAQTFERSNQLDSALKYTNNVQNYLKGINKWKTSADSIFIQRMLAFTMGNIYSKTGDYPIALAYYRSGAAMAIRDDIKKDVMDNYSGAAITFKKMGQLDSSIFYANKVLELSKVARNISVKLDVLNLLADVYKLKHNTDSVAKYLERTIETKDSLFNQQKVMQVQSMTFNEELRQQEIKDQQEQYQNRLRIYMLAGGLLVVLLLAGILYRNSLQKQKAKVKIEIAYEELKATQSQLIQSEKMASLGELTAGIAHEIQNPLNFVNNFSEVNKELIDELKSGLATGNMQSANEIADTIKDNEEKITQHGKRAEAVVKGMLQHSRISSSQKELTDINALADEYLRLAYHGLRAKDKTFNAKFETNLDPAVGKINIVPQEIGRVILNLINNAFYAVSQKQVSANLPALQDGSARQPYQPSVTVSTKKLRDKIEIRITDNGIGIPQKILDKIFQPFFTTKPAGQGTGLGLSLAYDIVKTHGGELKVETKEGGGSIFSVYLPQ